MFDSYSSPLGFLMCRGPLQTHTQIYFNPETDSLVPAENRNRSHLISIKVCVDTYFICIGNYI